MNDRTSIVHNYDSEEEAREDLKSTRSFVREYTQSYKTYKQEHNGEKMNHYQILMVEEDASIDEIKDMKQKLMVMFNKIPADKLTEAHHEIIATVKEADLTLSNPSKRAEYDTKLHGPKEPGRLSVKDAAKKYNSMGNNSPTPKKQSQSQGAALQ